ncbi:peptidoglycan-binding domain-containing protein [Baia soyae]|uniref:Putative peptidoglycan binding protein n=1 Tax=Baia soyae TaxID=1544746 RepID=A0A4R2RUV9_9BACL|nr:peptidoglycan-binding domain-containing protein [Baia soyae]TCP66467.1 putative peptidoglycan binding protein [Baia soyae]
MKSRVKRLVPILFMVLIVMAPITAFAHPMQDVWSKNDYVGSGYLSSGGYVQAVQRMLLETPWGYSGVDGRYGKNTKKGIMEFQENRKMKADGIVGSDTWARFQAYRSYVGAKGSAHLYQFI